MTNLVKMLKIQVPPHSSMCDAFQKINMALGDELGEQKNVVAHFDHTVRRGSVVEFAYRIERRRAL